MKSYSLDQLTKIGRKKFNLPEHWHCFMADTSNYPVLRFGLRPKDENGEWKNTEVYSRIRLG